MSTKQKYIVDEWHIAEVIWLNTPNGSAQGGEFAELSGDQQEPFLVKARNYLRLGAVRHIGLVEYEKPKEPEFEVRTRGFAVEGNPSKEQNDIFAEGVSKGLTKHSEKVVAAVADHFDDEKFMVVIAVVQK